MTEPARLTDLLYGFFPAQLIQTMARPSIPDQLASGPMPLAELADATGFSLESVTKLPPPTDYSVLRAVPA